MLCIKLFVFLCKRERGLLSSAAGGLLYSHFISNFCTPSSSFILKDGNLNFLLFFFLQTAALYQFFGTPKLLWMNKSDFNSWIISFQQFITFIVCLTCWIDGRRRPRQTKIWWKEEQLKNEFKKKKKEKLLLLLWIIEFIRNRQCK